MLNKPKGVVVTRSDELGRKTVYNLLPSFAIQQNWMPIGRLDKDSKGLILFTRNGHLSDLLTKPGKCVKVYELWIRGQLNDKHCQQVIEGVPTSCGLLRVKQIKRLGGSGPKTRLQVELNEGKNRHLRRIFGALKDPVFHTPLKVLELKRIQIGTIKLDIESSKWRFLTLDEEQSLILSAESGKTGNL